MKLLDYLKGQFLTENDELKYDNDEMKSKCVDIMLKMANRKLVFEDVAFGKNQPFEKNILKAIRVVSNEMGYGLLTKRDGAVTANIEADIQVMDDFSADPNLYVEYVMSAGSPAKFSEVRNRINDAFTTNPKLDKDNLIKSLQNYKVLKMAYDKKCESRWFRFKTHLFGSSAKMKSELESAEKLMVEKGINKDDMEFAASYKWSYSNMKTILEFGPTAKVLNKTLNNSEQRKNIELNENEKVANNNEASLVEENVIQIDKEASVDNIVLEDDEREHQYDSVHEAYENNKETSYDNDENELDSLEI